MKAFVSIVSSYVGCCVAHVLHYHGYCVVGSVREEDTEDIEAVVSETVDANDEAGTTRLALLSNVVVICLIEDIRGADAVLTEVRLSRHKTDGPSHLLMLSSAMTWANTKNVPPVVAATEMAPSHPLSRPASTMNMSKRSSPIPRVPSAMGGTVSSRENSRPLGTASSKSSGRGNHGAIIGSGFPRRRLPEAYPELGMTEDDYLLRQPPAGYTEHKRLEVVALSLKSTALSVCVVGAGVPYGLGEGPLLRVFQEAWRSSNAPIPLPTCTNGDNRLALVHVAYLGAAVGKLLYPCKNGSPSAPFPKPYILAVDGDQKQCTAKELTAALGRAFGGSGETRPLEEAELEEILIEDSTALCLLINVRFSNHGGVLAEMEADEKLESGAWSKGILASAKILTEEFLTSRSLAPMEIVVLGPPGGYQIHVCDQISRRYGIMCVDTKIAVDGVYHMLGKPLPDATAPEEKAPPPPKGKKAAKDTKKGAVKGELAPEAQAALAALPPAERLLVDIQAAFEAANVALSEYTNLGPKELAGLLSPSLVARSARLLLEEKKDQWARSGYILCDIPSRGDAALNIFGGCSPFRSSPKNTGGKVSNTEPRGGDSGGSSPPRTAPGQPEVIEYRPTHVIYLDASADFILAQKEQDSGAGGKEVVAKIKGDLERYFAEEQVPSEADGAGADALGQNKRQSDLDRGVDEQSGGRERWVPATAKALRDGYAAKTGVIDAERDVSAVAEAVDLHLTGGQVPAFIWMLSGNDVKDEGNDEINPTKGASGESMDENLLPEDIITLMEPEKEERSIQPSPKEGNILIVEESLTEVLAKLSVRDSKEVEARTQRHRKFLTDGVVPQVAAGLVAAAEARPEDPFEFLAEYLIRAGRALQTKAEAEAALKYQGGLALLKEMEAMEKTRTAGMYR